MDIPEIFKSFHHYKEESIDAMESVPCRDKIYEEFNRYDNINNKYSNALRKNNTLKLIKPKIRVSLVRIVCELSKSSKRLKNKDDSSFVQVNYV